MPLDIQELLLFDCLNSNDKGMGYHFDFVNPLYWGNPSTCTFANSENPDEIQDNDAFHQGLYGL